MSRTKQRNSRSTTPDSLRSRIKLRYRGPRANCKEQFAKDVITLYLTCGLGYAPIRRVLGIRHERKVTQVLNQHLLGRKSLEDYELDCPNSKYLSPLSMLIVQEIASRYGTTSDHYVDDMIHSGMWHDEKRTAIWKCSCGQAWLDTWEFCPICGTRRNSLRNHPLFSIPENSQSTTSRTEEII